MNKKYLIIGIIALLVIIGLLNNQTAHTTNREASVATVSQTSPTPTAKAMTFEEKVKAAAQSQYAQIDSVKIDDAVPSQKKVTVTALMNHAFGDSEVAKRDGLRMTTETIKNIFPVDNSIYSVTIQTNQPVVDTYGKTISKWLQTIIISRGTYSKIDFANFSYLDIPTIADSYAAN